MTYFITHGLPWIMSALTLWMTFLQGNVHPKAWLIGLVNQLLWTVWIVTMEAWGLIPLNIGLWVLYSRNHLKWQRGESLRTRGSSSPGNPVTLKDPQSARTVEADRPGAAMSSKDAEKSAANLVSSGFVLANDGKAADK